MLLSVLTKILSFSFRKMLRVSSGSVSAVVTYECIEIGDSLGFGFVENVQLLAHLSDGVVVLLPQVRHGLLMLNVCLFQVTAQFGHLCLTPLVQFDLRGCGTASLFQSFAQLFDFSGQVCALLLSLCSGLSFGFQLFFQLLNSGLNGKSNSWRVSRSLGTRAAAAEQHIDDDTKQTAFAQDLHEQQ
jgi:hypothetical protein